MDKKTWMAIAGFQTVACVILLVWSVTQLSTRANAVQTPQTAEAHWTIDELQPPEGATGEIMNLTMPLSSTSGTTTCFWIDTADVRFVGRAETYREERIAWLAAHYAHKVAAAIPNGKVIVGIERAGMAESGALHAFNMVQYPGGYIVISAGYRTGKDGQLTDNVKINIVSKLSQ